MFDLVLRELRLGALSLGHTASKSSRRAKAKSVNQANRPDRSTFNGDAKPFLPRAGKPVVAGRTVKHEMQRSYSHGHYPPASTGWDFSLAWKGVLDGSGAVDCDAADATIDSLGLAALEIGEVEPHMFRQLALLCSVRQHAVTRTQLAHPSALRSIFSLLKIGSPRIQR